MTDQEYIESISGRTDDDYPAVIQVSDPLLVRVSKTSLLLNDTNFYAKIKKGLAFYGYVIYSSGLGTPIIEVNLGSQSDTTDDGTVPVQQESDVDISELEDAASKFLDILEARVATSEFQNPVKAAIDRLCWQIHYDITKSGTNFVTEFEDQGFSKSVISVDGWSADGETEGRTLYDYFGWVGVEQSDPQNPNVKILVNETGLIGMTQKVSWSLKKDDEVYSVSKALREIGDDSVSGATREQTDLEEQKFIEISDTKLGNFGGDAGGGKSYKTLFETIGNGFTDPDYFSMHSIIGYEQDNGSHAPTYQNIYAAVNSLSGTVSTINQNVTVVNQDVSNIDSKLGVFPQNKTVYSELQDVKTDVGDVKTDVGTVTSNVSTVAADVGIIRTDVSAVKSNLGTHTSTADGSLFAYWNSVYYPVTSGGPTRATLLAFPNTKTWT